MGQGIKAPKRQKKQSTWTTSDVAFVVIGSSVLLGIVLLVGTSFWQVVPKFDPEKVLVEKWLEENLEDGKWEQVKWFPAVRLQNLYDMNLLHIIENMEKAKTAYEKGSGGNADDLAEYQKHYDKFRNSEVRIFCALKYRVTTLNGQGKILRSQVFEIVKGSAKPCVGNDIVETQSSPLKQSLHPVSYDGLRFFDDPDFDPFPVVRSDDFDERAQAAMDWKAPALPATPVSPSIPSQQSPQVVAVDVPTIEPEEEAAEGIPFKIREYFDRAMQMKSTEVTKLEKRLSDFESRLRSAKKIVEKTALTERIRQTEDQLAELKVSDFTAFLPERPEIGDIGLFQVVEVIEIVDQKTLIVRWLPNGKGRLPRLDVAIHPTETDEIKIGDANLSSDFFRVTATKGERSDLLTNLKAAGNGVAFVAEPVENLEIEKWQSQYEKENKKK